MRLFLNGIVSSKKKTSTGLIILYLGDYIIVII
jgi:hypothetical protein